MLHANQNVSCTLLTIKDYKRHKMKDSLLMYMNQQRNPFDSLNEAVSDDWIQHL